MVVYELLELDHEIPAISRHDKSTKVKFDAAIKAFAWWHRWSKHSPNSQLTAERIQLPRILVGVKRLDVRKIAFVRAAQRLDFSEDVVLSSSDGSARWTFFRHIRACFRLPSDEPKFSAKFYWRLSIAIPLVRQLVEMPIWALAPFLYQEDFHDALKSNDLSLVWQPNGGSNGGSPSQCDWLKDK